MASDQGSMDTPREGESNAVAPAADAGAPGGMKGKWRWLIAGAALLVLAYPAIMSLLPSARSAGPSGNLLQLSFQKYQQKKYKESIEAATEYLKTNPAAPDAYNNIAVSYLELGQYDDAARNAAEALRLNPNYQLAKNNLAWILRERQKVLGGNPPPSPSTPLSPAALLLNQSLQQYNARQFPECVESAKAAVKLDPGYAEAYNNMAACESSQSHFDAAIAAAQEALRLKPDFPLARNNLAWAMKKRAEK